MAEMTVVVELVPAPIVKVAPPAGPVVKIELEPAPIVSAPQTGLPGPPGPTGPLAQMTHGEIPFGLIDGLNNAYTSAAVYVPDSLAVFLNGLRQRRGDDYQETGTNSFSFLNAPITGDSLSIDYTNC